MSQTVLEVVFKGTDKGLTAAAGGVKSAMGGLAKGLGIAATAGVAAAAGLGIVGTKLVGLGSDANETASLLKTALGGAFDGFNSRLREFASVSNRSFFELQAGSSTLVAMTKSMGATNDAAADMSFNFTKMAVDLGSFFNVSDSNVLQDFQSALAGSSETLQKYGIDVRETTLKQMALDQGLIGSATDTLPRLVRAQLIQQAVQEQAADAMGDAARTSDSWANSTRGLSAMFKDVSTQVGTELIPVLQPLLAAFVDFARDVMPAVSDYISTTLIPALGVLVNWLQINVPIALQVLSDFWTNVLQPAIETVWAYVQ